ncbi:MAG: beta strand repeat-containing protein [Desulfatibacillaceae bacterium]
MNKRLFRSATVLLLGLLLIAASGCGPGGAANDGEATSPGGGGGGGTTPTPPATQTLSGYVLANSTTGGTQPVSGATVLLFSETQSVTTNMDGEYEFTIEQGTDHTILASWEANGTFTEAFSYVRSGATSVPLFLQQYTGIGRADGYPAAGASSVTSNMVSGGQATLTMHPQTAGVFRLSTDSDVNNGTTSVNSVDVGLINLDLHSALPFPLPSTNTRTTSLNADLGNIGAQSPLAVVLVRPGRLKSLAPDWELRLPQPAPAIATNLKILHFDPALHVWTDTGYTYNDAIGGSSIQIDSGGLYGVFEQTGNTRSVTGTINAPAGTLVFIGDKYYVTRMDNELVDFRNIPVPADGNPLTMNVILEPTSDTPEENRTTVDMAAATPVINPVPVEVTDVAISSSNTSIVADNAATATITAVVTGEGGAYAAEGSNITFSTSEGVFTESNADTAVVQTDATGKAVVHLTSQQVVSSSVSIMAAAQNGVESNTLTLAFVPDVPAVVDFKDTMEVIQARGVTSIPVEAMVKDQWGHPVADGTNAQFAIQSSNGQAPGELLDATSDTTTSGVATVNFVGTAYIGYYTLTCQSGGINSSADMHIRVEEPPIGSVILSARETELVASGSDTTTLTAEITYSTGDPVVDGTNVTLATTGGTLSDGTTTGTSIVVQTSNGTASANLTSSRRLGLVDVSATADNGLSDELSIDFVAGAPSQVAFESSEYTLTADGTTEQMIRGVVQDAYNNLVNEDTLYFEVRDQATGMSLPWYLSDQGPTVTNGVVSTNYLVSSTPGDYSVNVYTAGGQTPLASVQIHQEPLPVGSVTLSTSASSITADGTSYAIIYATARYTNGTTVADNTAISFSTDAGKLARTSTGSQYTTTTATTSQGVARIYLFSSTQLGTATVTTDVEGVTNSASVEFVAGGVDQLAFVSPYTYSLTADGQSTAELRVRAKDANGHLVAEGTTVNFMAYKDGQEMPSMLQTLNATTSGGYATTVFMATTDLGAYTVTATTSSVPGGVLIPAVVELIEPPMGAITVSAGSPTIVADGATQSVIRAQATYLNNQSVRDGTVVAFSTTAGSLSLGDPDPAEPTTLTTTTLNGLATVMLTSTEVLGVATVTASRKGVSGNADVEFVAGSVDEVKASADPVTLPADGSSQSAINVWAEDANDNVIPSTTFTAAVTSGSGSVDPVSGSSSNGFFELVYTAGQTPGPAVVTVTSTIGTSKSTAVPLTLINSPVGAISVVADPTEIRANGGTTTFGKSTITATLSDTLDQPMIAGTQVLFTTNTGTFATSDDGTVSPDGKTYTTSVIGSSGRATATLKSSNTAGETAQVRASSGGVNSQPADVVFLPTPAYLSLVTDRSFVSSDDSDQATITASVLSSNFVPINDVAVQFSATGGTLSASSKETGSGGDSDGKSSVTFSSGTTDRFDQVVTITASINELTVTRQVPIEIRGTSVELALGNTSLELGGAGDADRTTLSVSVLDAGDIPISDARVNVYASGAGSVNLTPTFGDTDVNGQIQFTVQGASAGSVTLTATAYDPETDAGGASKTVTSDPVTLTVSTTGNAFRIVTPSANQVNRHTDETVTVVVDAPDQTDSEGGTRRIENVKFLTSLGSWNTTSNQMVTVPVTAAGGYRRATATLSSTEAGIASVQVYDEDDTNLRDSLQVTFSAPASASHQVSLQATKTVINPNGGVDGTAGLIAKVKSQSDQPVADAPVQFTIQNPTGGGEHLSQVLAFTDSNGEAKSNLVSGTASSDGAGITVTARVLSPSTARNVTFDLVKGNGGNPTITRDTGSFIDEGFKAGMKVEVSGSTLGNDGVYTISSLTATVLTLNTSPDFAADEPGATTIQLVAYIRSSVSIVINGTPSSIVIGLGSNATRAPGAEDAGYAYPVTLLVADNNGSPVEGASVSISLWPEMYYTGYMSYPEDDDPSVVRLSRIIAEDLNRNQILDPGEDVNGDGRLTPSVSAAGNVPYSATTDANGLITFNHIYLTDQALWLKVRLRATTVVQGTETVEEISYVLPVLQEDIDAEVIGDSPYGSCAWCGDVVKKAVSPGSFDYELHCEIQPQMIGGVPTGEDRCQQYKRYLPDYTTSPSEYSDERGSVSRIAWEANQYTLTADGTSSVSIKATVSTESGELAFNGEQINFTVTDDSGTSNPEMLANTSEATSLGSVYAEFLSTRNPGTYTLTATAPDATTPVTMTPVVLNLVEPPVGTVQVAATSSSIVANGSSQSDIIAQLTYTNGQTVIDGTEVVFTTDAGSLSGGSTSSGATTYTTTTSQGMAAVRLTSSTNLGTATVSAVSGAAVGQVNVSFVAGPVDEILLSANPNSLPGDGRTTSTITATATDANGNVVDGATVNFSVTGLGSVSPTTGTIQNGQVQATYTAGGEPGQATVTCTATNGKNDSVVLTLLSPSISGVQLVADPVSIKANGGDSGGQSTISATVTNTDGQPASENTKVVFTTSHGSFENAPAETPRTYTGTTSGSTGVATATLNSSTSSGVTASVSAKSEGVNSNTVEIEFTPVPALLAIKASKSFVRSDNSTTSTITASVLDTNRVPVGGTTVTFSVTGGSISASSRKTLTAEEALVEDGNAGEAIVVFRSGTIDRANQTVNITAEVSELDYTRTVPVEITGTHLDVTSDSQSLQITGTTSNVVNITAKVLDHGNNAIPDATVSLTPTTDNTNVLIRYQPVDSAGNPMGSLTTNSQGKVYLQVWAEKLVAGVSGSADGSLRFDSMGATANQDLNIGEEGDVFVILEPDDDPLFLHTGEPQSLTVLAPPQTVSAGPPAVTRAIQTVVFVTSYGTWDGTDQHIVYKTVQSGDIDGDGNNEDYATASLVSQDAGVASVQVYDEDDPDLSDRAQIYYSAPFSESYQVSLQAERTVVALNGDSSTLSARVQNKADQVVSDAPVLFSIVDPVSGGENILPSIAYTGPDGVASTVFTSGSISTDQEGLTVRARVLAPFTDKSASFQLDTVGGDPVITRTDTGSFLTDGFKSGLKIEVTGTPSAEGNDGIYTIADADATRLTLDAAATSTRNSFTTSPQTVASGMRIVGYITSSVSINIGGTAGSVIIGLGTTISTDPDSNNTANQLPVSVLVADTNGNPSPNADVSFSLWPVHYSTGYWFWSAVDEEWVAVDTATLHNEDKNQNSILDPYPVGMYNPQGEDVNMDGQLTPANSAAGNIPDSGTTGDSGIFAFNHTYLKAYAPWIRVRMQASTKAFGSETRTSYSYTLKVHVDDVAEDASPADSPYGWCPWCFTSYENLGDMGDGLMTCNLGKEIEYEDCDTSNPATVTDDGCLPYSAEFVNGLSNTNESLVDQDGNACP